MSTLVHATPLKKKIFIVTFPFSFIIAHFLVVWAGSVEKLSSWSPMSCPLNRFLGIHCPTCGLTRSLMATWNFDFNLALKYHFLGPVLFVTSTFIWLLFCFQKESILTQWISKLRSHPRFSLWSKMAVLTYIIWGFVFHNIP